MQHTMLDRLVVEAFADFESVRGVITRDGESDTASDASIGSDRPAALEEEAGVGAICRELGSDVIFVSDIAAGDLACTGGGKNRVRDEGAANAEAEAEDMSE